MKAFVLCAAALAIPLPGRADTVAVLDLDSRVPAAEIKVAPLAEQVRSVAARTLGESRILDAETCSRHCDPRAVGADLVVSGELIRGGDGYLVTLELRRARSDRLVGAASATGANQEELADAVAGAAVDLFRAQKAVSAVSISPAVLPEVPQPAPLLAGGAVNLDVDATVLVAYDDARTVEQTGTQRPDEAAAAWRAVAELGGENPYREMAASRARQWQDYAEGKRAFDEQFARDTSRLRKVLPLAFVTEGTKLELVSRYARAYGGAKAEPLLVLLPGELRGRAQLAIGCEDKNGASCMALARAADKAHDPQGALDALDRACSANLADACAEAGDRWLRPETRDVARALPALERGCGAGSARACARLARVYEDGDGTAPSVSLAADLRDKACANGDGKSCRRLASVVEDEARAAALLKKGCADGDARSCAMARAVAPQTQAVDAVAKSGAPDTPPAPAPKPALPEATESHDSTAGFALVGLAAVAVGGAVVMAMPMPDDHGRGSNRRGLTEAQPAATSSRTGLVIGLSAAAALSATTGMVLLFSHHSAPEKPKVNVGVSPAGLVISGTMP
jgi:TPR repeat protein